MDKFHNPHPVKENYSDVHLLPDYIRYSQSKSTSFVLKRKLSIFPRKSVESGSSARYILASHSAIADKNHLPDARLKYGHYTPLTYDWRGSPDRFPDLPDFSNGSRL